jgi:multidrug efflux pump
MISHFFIDRPCFAWVVAIFIVLAGLLSFRSLPVSQYPNVAPPTITMYVTYRGASAETLAQNVVSVIEEELNGLRNLLYFSSQSNSTGIAEIQVTFQPGTDPALAQVDVQNRLRQVEADLPPEVTRQGIAVEQANAGFLLMYALSVKEGHTGDIDSLADYATRNINNELRRIDGVGRVQLFAEERAMRIWVDPDRLTAYGLSMQDAERAIANQNRQLSTGRIGAAPALPGQGFSTAIQVEGLLADPEEFGRVIVRAKPDGSTVRLSEVAEVKSGSQSYLYNARLNGEQAVVAAVLLQPGANALATATRVKATLESLSARFPQEMAYSIPYETTRFVEVVITKVFMTLLEALVLVFLVMWLFLQNLRYTLIPIVVVPISLIGTLAVIYITGFSINMMTLFGMVLAIGILVDDAIIVVENVERIMAVERLSPKQATIKAMQQISGAIISITAVLTAVFLPLAFMAGVVGVIYRQFSISLAVSILFSGFLALTLTPVLCVTLLKPVAHDHAPASRGLFGWFNRTVASMNQRYATRTARLVERTGRYMVIYLALIVALGWAYNRLPSGFLPEEDMGYGLASVQLAPGATMERTKQTVKLLETHYAKPALRTVRGLAGRLQL